MRQFLVALSVVAFRAFADDGRPTMIERTLELGPTTIRDVANSVAGSDAAAALLTNDAALATYFAKAGVPFPPGAILHLTSPTGTVAVRNTPENIELLQRVLAPLCCVSYQAELTLSLYEYDAANTNRGTARASVSGLAKSGLHHQSARIDTGAAQTNSLSSSTLSFVGTVGPDGEAVDITLTWDAQYARESRDAPAVSLSLATALVVRTGNPVTILRSRNGDRMVEVVASVRVLDEYGQRVRRLE